MNSEILEVPGFLFSGVYCGIKENPTKKDLALIYSIVPAAIAASYTSNVAKAAPVLLDEMKMKGGLAQAIVVNSGNANACTGALGMKNAKAMVKQTAKALSLKEELVFVSSTGKIGVQLPMPKIKKGIEMAAEELASRHLEKAAHAILTTDYYPKYAFAQGVVGGKKYHVAGFAKGAGMIEPAMQGPHATMLAYFVTDLNISQKLLQKILNQVVDASFNRITVDGDMSTNDTAMILANGLVGNESVKENSKEAKEFQKNLEKIALDLAMKIAEDGEGATKVVKIQIENAKNEKQAKDVAYRVARSQLVKTSFFGKDPNWGRLLAAVGYSGIQFKPEKVDIYYEKVKVVSKGLGLGQKSEKAAHEVMKNKHFTIRINLNEAKSAYHVWTSDLTFDYVKLNAEYRT